eukprot:scaffold779_cov205-Alexandrium_tamarense.AAC.36
MSHVDSTSKINQGWEHARVKSIAGSFVQDSRGGFSLDSGSGEAVLSLSSLGVSLCSLDKSSNS